MDRSSAVHLEYQALFESLPGLYLILAPDEPFEIVAVSDAYLRATMTERAQIVGRALFDVFPDNPDDPQATGSRNLRASLDRVRTLRRPDAMAVQKYDIRRPASEGGGFEERFWSPLNAPVLDTNGVLTHIVHRVEDVTDFVRLKSRYAQKDAEAEHFQRRAEQMEVEIFQRAREAAEARLAEREMSRAKDLAESANEAKDQFLAVLSHELRTPLTPVLLTVSLLETTPDLPAQVREDLHTIRHHVELEARLIDDLLDITRVSRGKLELHAKEAVDLHRVLRLALDVCCADRVDDIVLAINARHHHVRGDAVRLQQVFYNLLGNAVKFTPQGRAIHVRTMNSDDAGGTLRVEVADSGIGIDPAILPSIFNAFEQGDRSLTRNYGGLGLGLTISKALVEAHGGTIAALSDGTGRGATLTVELPTVASPKPSATPAPIASGAGRHVGRLRILLIEDHEGTVEVMTRLLRTLGHDVLVARTVAEAVAASQAANDGIDLIVSDVGLPDGTGHDVMRALAPRFPQAKAIAVSGYGMDEDVRASLDAGFAQHLVKPVDLDALRAAIERIA